MFFYFNEMSFLGFENVAAQGVKTMFGRPSPEQPPNATSVWRCQQLPSMGISWDWAEVVALLSVFFL